MMLVEAGGAVLYFDVGRGMASSQGEHGNDLGQDLRPRNSELILSNMSANDPFQRFLEHWMMYLPRDMWWLRKMMRCGRTWVQ